MAAKDDFCVDNSDDFDYDDDRNLCEPPKFKRKRPSSSSFYQDSSSSAPTITELPVVSSAGSQTGLPVKAKKSESWGEKKPFEWRNSGHSSDSSSETDPKVGNFIQRIVDAHDLGQHGGKLLLELSSSVFAPTMVVGCICMGTEVIFTYLETKEAHLNKITYDGRCDEPSEGTLRADSISEGPPGVTSCPFIPATDSYEGGASVGASVVFPDIS
uniref:Uncharacterized protein n=1 Tax=Magallana gigas TaxID=29159 RepID=K1R560_MAGGI